MKFGGPPKGIPPGSAPACPTHPLSNFSNHTLSISRENLKVFSEDGLTYRPLKVLAKVVSFSLLWVVTSYVYLRALDLKPCLDVITLFATNSSFVYLLAWILLQKQFMAIRVSLWVICVYNWIIIGSLFSNLGLLHY